MLSVAGCAWCGAAACVWARSWRSRLDGAFRQWAVYDEDFADVLHRRCMERPANLAQQLIAHRVHARKHADLDQFMAAQVLVNFVEHRGAQAGVPYDHDRCRRWARAAQRAALR